MINNIKEFKMTFKLYVKTHSTTGLKYLGFTAKDDPHKYPGSGFHWRKHLKCHGKKYTTDIILETDDLQMIRDQGIYYSQLWDVVKSANWANEKPESGPGVIHSPEMIRKQLETKRRNGTLNSNTPESISKANASRALLDQDVVNSKRIATRVKNGTLNSNTPESIAKAKASKEARGLINGKNPDLECVHCHRVISLGNHIRWHGDKCKSLTV